MCRRPSRPERRRAPFLPARGVACRPGRRSARDGRGLAAESLEPRAMLTSFAYGAGALNLDIDTINADLAIVATGSNGYVVTSSDLFTGIDLPGKIEGAGTNTLTVFPAFGLTDAFVTDSETGVTVDLAGGTPGSTWDADFVVALAIPGSGTMRVVGDTSFSAGHGLAASAARIEVDALLESVGGFLTLDADEGIQAEGVSAGLAISAAGVVRTSTGAITIEGRGGDSLLGDEVGVTIAGSIHAGDDGISFGTVAVSGVGGLSAGGDRNHGVVVAEGGRISTTGGAVTLAGRGAESGSENVGIVMAGAIETSSDAGGSGAVTADGSGGGGAGSSGNYGIWLRSTGRVRTEAGAVRATGRGGVGNPLSFFPFTDSPGFYVDNGSVESLAGALEFTADSFYGDINAGGSIATTATATVRNLLPGQLMEIGPDFNPLLEAIVTPRLVVGRDDIRPVIFQAEGPGGTLALAAGTSLELVGQSISLRAAVVTPGAEQVYRGPVFLGDLVPSADVTLTGAASFTSTISGGGRSLTVNGDASFAGAVSGLADLVVTGATLAAADIGTTASQQYAGAVTLGAPLVTLTSPAGNLAGGVIGAGNSLAIDFGGVTLVDGASFTGIDSLSTGGGGTTELTGSLVTTGAMGFGDDVRLGTDTALSSGAGGVTFSGSLDGARNLSLSAGAGAISFGGAVGAGTALASLAILSGTSATALGTVAIDGSAPGALANGLVIGIDGVDLQVPGSSVRNCAGSGVVLFASAGSVLAGIAVEDNAAYGIHLSGNSPGTVLRDVSARRNVVGISLDAAGGLVIEGGTEVVGNTAYGIHALGIATQPTVIRSTMIDGDGVGVYGVFLDGAKHVRLGEAGAGNVVIGSAIGIQATGGLGGSEIVDNLVESNGTGIVVSSGRNLVAFSGNRVAGNTHYGILGQGTNVDVSIVGNIVSGSTVGVCLVSGTGLTVDDNDILGNGVHGIYAAGDSTGTVVSRNAVAGSGDGTFGVFLDGATDLLLGGAAAGNSLTGAAIGIYGRGALDGTAIRGNSVSGNGSGLVLVGATGLAVDGANVLSDSAAYGILVQGAAAGTTIGGNTVERSVVGVVLENAVGAGVVAGNRVTGSSAYGLLATGDCSGSTVSGNVIDSNVVGVGLIDARGLAVSGNNEIVANTFHGIYAAGDAAGTTITGNVVNGSSLGAFGVFLDGVAGLAVGTAGGINTVTGNSCGIYARGTLAGTVVENNAVSGNGSAIVLADARGLSVRGGNRFIGSSAFGLYGTGDCAGTLVEGNDIEGNSSGVVLDSARRITVVNLNRIVSNAAFGLFAQGDSTGTTVLGNTITGNGVEIDTSAAVGGTFQTS